MTTRDWIIVCMIGAGLMLAVMETGCTADLWQDATFSESGVYECSARNPGYEDLPVYVIDTDTADPKYRQGFATDSTLTMNTVDGERVTFDVQGGQPGWFCVQLEES